MKMDNYMKFVIMLMEKEIENINYIMKMDNYIIFVIILMEK